MVFTADFSVTAGRQFDRTGIVDMGFVNLYFGTTAEPRQNLAPSWHVERDVTDYNALFTSPQSGFVILGNIPTSTARPLQPPHPKQPGLSLVCSF